MDRLSIHSSIPGGIFLRPACSFSSFPVKKVKFPLLRGKEFPISPQLQSLPAGILVSRIERFCKSFGFFPRHICQFSF
jgi:hypothetical protein